MTKWHNLESWVLKGWSHAVHQKSKQSRYVPFFWLGGGLAWTTGRVTVGGCWVEGGAWAGVFLAETPSVTDLSVIPWYVPIVSILKPSVSTRTISPLYTNKKIIFYLSIISFQVFNSSTSWFPPSCLGKNSRTFQDPQNIFSRTLYTAHALLNLLYMVSSTANTLDQVHCIQRCNTQTHYVWNAKYFKIHRQFVSVSKTPNLA